MHLKIGSSLTALCLTTALLHTASAQKGFFPQNSPSYHSIENKFVALLNKDSIGKRIQNYAYAPHHLGSERGKIIAEDMLARLKSWGWNAEIETYYVLFPTPKSRQLELLTPNKYTATLVEETYAADSLSSFKNMLPPYNAWSADSDVTGQLVFVNYGLPEDYEELERRHIDVKGKIVIAKYGHSWRGIKGKIAQEHGAIGTIMYSDPSDDGYTKGDTYPAGPYKNEYTVQRGSVMDMVVYPGDPLTPGIGSTKNAKRLKRSEVKNLLKIPVLPISYHDALPLLQSLKGAVAPANWSGTLPITYHIGDESTTVHLKVISDWKTVPAYDVVATIKGSEFPDEWIIRGNHHDAWVHGAADPVSGLAEMLEEAKSIGQLYQNGWKPKRTIKYIAWDGEEPALLGSTEWVENHATELQQKAVAYINTDGSGRGIFSVGGSHTLQPFINEVAADVIDPVKNVSIQDRKRAYQLVNGKKDIPTPAEMPIDALGSGSDYTAFLQHLGIPALNMEFGGEDQGGEYHTNFDTYYDFAYFKDPGFHYELALAQAAGKSVLRLANADILPFDFPTFGKTIAGYLHEIEKLYSTAVEKNQKERQFAKENLYLYASDTALHLPLPKMEDTIPYIDFSSLTTAISSLQNSSVTLQNKLQTLAINDKEQLQKINIKLYQAEQQLLTKEGLPMRNWFKHTIYAPGFYTGYGVKTIPGVREAIEQKKWSDANQQILIVATQIQHLANYLDQIN